MIFDIFNKTTGTFLQYVKYNMRTVSTRKVQKASFNFLSELVPEAGKINVHI
jgi:hypothetical protein